MTIKDIDVSWRGGIFFRGCDDSNPDALWKVRGGPKQPAIPPTLFFSSFFFLTKFQLSAFLYDVDCSTPSSS
jgi:hypothetical protein